MKCVRIKGTNIKLRVLGIGEYYRGDGMGLYCEYLNGENAGQTQTIPGDCVVEDND